MYNFNCQSNSCILKFCFYCIISMILLLLYRQTCQFYYLPHCKIKLFFNWLRSFTWSSLFELTVTVLHWGFFCGGWVFFRFTIIHWNFFALPYYIDFCHCLHCIALDFVALPLSTLYCPGLCCFAIDYFVLHCILFLFNWISISLFVNSCLFVCLGFSSHSSIW